MDAPHHGRMEASIRRALRAIPVLLRLAPATTVTFLFAPVAAGLIGTLLPAFAYWPAIGANQPSLSAWRDLAHTPGILQAMLSSLSVGVLTTLFSLTAVIVILAVFQGTAMARLIARLVPPMLAVPHLALAIGFAFVIAPSGWIFRLIAAIDGRFEQPPDWLIVNDPAGLSLIAGLCAKEIPFLFFIALTAIPQVEAARLSMVARTLGYGRCAAWIKAVLPRLYPQLRLPLLAVLSYSVSVVDVAMILGPTRPPTLSVQILRWASDPDLTLRLRAGAGALMQLLITFSAIALWISGERLSAWVGKFWIHRGSRWFPERLARWLAAAFAVYVGLAVLASGLVLMLWSFAAQWQFPRAFPSAITTHIWSGAIANSELAIGHSIGIAVAVTFVALVLSLACLENERHQRPTAAATVLLYIPLIIPQIAFLGGIQWLLLFVRADIDWLSVGFAHLIFVLPYVFLALAETWRTYDERYRTIARCLGASPGRVFWTIQLPMQVRPVAAAAAIGIAVSATQYLPTLLCSSGRFETITTLALTLSSGGDRRLAAIYALLQASVPLVAFILAIAIPALVFRGRKMLANA
jgi:putative thiamine transport system permease protein